MRTLAASRKAKAGLLFAAVGAVALGFAARSGKVAWLGGPVQGSALNGDAVFFYGSKDLAPNQRFVMMFNDIINASDRPVVLRSIEPISLPNPEVARLERIEVALAGPGQPGGGQSIYPSYPPAVPGKSRASTCSYTRVSAPNGFELPPSGGGRTAGLMVMMVRTVGFGETSFEVGRVVYELDGRNYEQEVRMRFELGVTGNGRRVVQPRARTSCPDARYLVPQPPAPAPEPLPL